MGHHRWLLKGNFPVKERNRDWAQPKENQNHEVKAKNYWQCSTEPSSTEPFLALNCLFTSVKDEIHIHSFQNLQISPKRFPMEDLNILTTSTLFSITYFQKLWMFRKVASPLNPRTLTPGTTAEVFFSRRSGLRSSGQLSALFIGGVMLQVLPLKCWGFLSNGIGRESEHGCNYFARLVRKLK